MISDSIERRRLLFLTGKGGTGRTVFSSALGQAFARRGERTLLIELDSNATLGALFGMEDIDDEPRELVANLFAARMQGLQAMKRFLRRFVPSRRVTDLLLKNRVAMTLFESAPGVFDTVMLDRIAAFAADDSWDRIVVDLPATGHAKTLLQLPDSMADAFGGGELSRHIGRLGELIADPQVCALVVVTLPEEMPVTETVEFCLEVGRTLRVDIAAVIANAVRDVRMDADNLDELEGAVRQTSHLEQQRASRIRMGISLARFWAREDRAGVERLRRDLSHLPVLELPYIMDRIDDRSLVDSLAKHLDSKPTAGIAHE